MTALIPARGGSKGIPRKNLCSLGGIPLLAHALRNARGARSVERTLVSTDCPEIAEAARALGAEVLPRPAWLAGDEVPMRDVLVHAFRALEAEGRAPGVLALLQPTSPFLSSSTVDRAVEVLQESRARVLKAVRRVKEHPDWMLERRGDLLVPHREGPVRRRQDLPELFIPCGALYLYRDDWLREPADGEPSAWVEVEWPESIDIDEPRDLEEAEWVIGKGLAGAGRSDR